MSSRLFRTKDFLGKDMLENAERIGQVKDIAFDVIGNIALGVSTKTMVDRIIPMDEVEALGDIILIKKTSPSETAFRGPSATTPPPSTEARTAVHCHSCGYANKPSAKFCYRCGARLII